MIIGGRRAPLLLFLGDLATFVASLFITLWIRYQAVPTLEKMAPFVTPFALLFILWILVFYMAGLYGKRLALFPSRVPDTLLATQIVNIVFAALFFFFLDFGIEPKTILLLYLAVSLAGIFIWRLALATKISFPRTEHALLIAHGPEADELVKEVNGNPRYGIEFAVPSNEALHSKETLLKEIEATQSTTLVLDPSYKNAEEVIPHLYRLTYVERQFQFATFDDVYEEVFDRIPLTRLGHTWFLEEVDARTSVSRPVSEISSSATTFAAGS